MKVTVVIPNWNGEKYLRTCLDSLRKQDTDDFSVLVIDNGSTDSSVSIIKENYPEFSLIELSENTGFTGAVNLGMEKSETPFVLLLNNDVEADKSFVSELTKTIERDEKIFSVSSRMISFSNRELLDDAGDFYTVLGYQFQRGTGLSVRDPRYQKSYPVFSSCGGAAIYRKSILDKIGFLDPAHFAYLEDVDLGYRALLYGYKNLYEPKAVVYHIGSASSGAVKYSDFKVRLSARNSQYLIYKNMFLFFRIVNALPLYLGRVVKRRFFRKEGFSEAYEEGLREAREKKKTLKKVPCTGKTFWNHFLLEFRLIGYTFLYVSEYLKRRKLKH